MSEDQPQLLRHTLATLAYRGGKALRGAPAGFTDFRPAPGSRSAGEILAHIGDLLDWGLSLARGKQAWNDSKPRSWDEDTARFFAGLKAFDDYLASNESREPAAKLFQGPIADAFTHVGQIGMLRRLAGGPVRGENYHKADIQPGRVGAEQAEPKREFD